jgi:hypothetical protein
MSFTSRPLKNKKPQLKCATCQEVVTPKNGDWHQAEAGHQYFLCRVCEAKARVKAK